MNLVFRLAVCGVAVFFTTVAYSELAENPTSFLELIDNSSILIYFVMGIISPLIAMYCLIPRKYHHVASETLEFIEFILRIFD